MRPPGRETVCDADGVVFEKQKERHDLTMNIENLCMGCMKEVEQPGVCPHCGYDSNAAPQEGHYLKPCSILNGKYLVGRVLGEGGFGITYIGYDLNLEMPVAIKEFYPNGFVTRESSVTSVISMYAGTSLEAVQKWKNNFIKEARTLARYSNLSGIVGVKDFFEENGTAYIAMEYLHGMTLKEYAKMNGGRLDTNYLLQCLKPVMASLARVHESGLIHRDISPDNIMLLEGGSMKLLDFGAARDYTADGEKSLSVMLKPGYAPEEQYRTKGKQGPWSDVYAFAATMYKCITGVTPPESMERLRQDDLKSPSSLGIPISPAVENALLKGMEVYAENRFQSMSEFMEALYGQSAYTVQTAQTVPSAVAGGQNLPVVRTPGQMAPHAGQSATGADAGRKNFEVAVFRQNFREVFTKLQDRIGKKYWWYIVAAIWIAVVILLAIGVSSVVGSGKQEEKASSVQSDGIDDTPASETGTGQNTDALDTAQEDGAAKQAEEEALAQQKAAEDAIRYGKEKLEEGDYDTALAYFEEAVGYGTLESEEAYGLSSDAYLRKGDVFSAVEILDTGIEQTGKTTLETRKKYILENTHILTMEAYQGNTMRRHEEYDSDGNLLREEVYDESGNCTEWGIYEYWDGLLSYEEHFYDSGRTSLYQEYTDGVESYFCFYDQQGTITSESSFNYSIGRIDRQVFYEKGKSSWWKTFEYDRYGNRIMDKSYNANGTMSSWQEYGFDDVGNMVRTAGYKADGSLNAAVEWEYDEYGNVIRESNFDSDGSYAWGMRYEYEYDVFGNPIVKRQYDGDSSNPDAEWSYRYEYQFNF